MCIRDRIKAYVKNLPNILGALECFVYDPLRDFQMQRMRESVLIPAESPAQAIEKLKRRVLFSDHRGSREDGIDSIIEDCRSDVCLREMYFGWQPHMQIYLDDQ
eukprot:TRINITY_DN7722_c0_g1_i2.p1 TRINITY_DN7722_c0_g1~~TRINITY_DN7722_c0_g1_i2.p1  ORF type:complete len:104 (+),score=11.83 TRINITY_DN7722_c0_g1_i2:94-405(+)